MDNNLNSEQNYNKRKNSSRTIGIVGIILAIFGWVFFMFLMPESLYYAIPTKSWTGVIFFYYLIVFIIAIWGLIKGVKQLSKESGLAGIALSFVAFALTITLWIWLELSIFASST